MPCLLGWGIVASGCGISPFSFAGWEIPNQENGSSSPVEVTDLDWRLDEEMGSLVHVSWHQDIPGLIHVEYSFDEGIWLSSPTFEGASGVQEQLLVGIPFDTDASWRVVPDVGDRVNGETITSGAVPEGLPIATVEVADPEAWLPEGKYLLTSVNADGGWSSGTFWTFIVDREARPVWARSAPNKNWTLFAQVAVTGDHLLWDEATLWSQMDGGAGSKVHRTYLDGEIDVITTPGHHHAFVQLQDGTLVWGSQNHGGGEALVEKGLDEDQETVIWTCDDDWPDHGGCESNGLFYQEVTDSFLYSFYTNNSLVEVDHATGESLWWAGQVSGGYSFEPSSSQISWQHGISYTDAGTLLVSTDGDGATILREYAVDHDAQILTEVWSFNAGIHASTNGDAWRLANGNTLHLVGSGGELYEVTPDGEMVWHLNFQSGLLLGRGQFIEDLYKLVSPG